VPFAGTIDDINWVMNGVIIQFPEEDEEVSKGEAGAVKGWTRGKVSV
jgi:hypothetical protein